MFPHNYTYDLLDDLPRCQTLALFDYPRTVRDGRRNGVTVGVCLVNGNCWYGKFSFGQFGTVGLTGIFTMPDPGKMCVVAKGIAYIVNVDIPASWEIVQAQPVLKVLQIVAHNMIVFVDYTKITAYGLLGMKWRTDRLSWDDLNIIAVTETAIECEFCDPLNGDKMARVEVDIATGKHIGGLPQGAV